MSFRFQLMNINLLEFIIPLILCFQTRIFVTHGLAYLPQCDVIVTMENGIICEIGGYAELIDNNGAFAEFVRTYASMEDNDEEGEAGILLIITCSLLSD